MKSSEACHAIIKQFEGMHDGDKRTPLIEPMADPVGIPTIGWGCTFYEDGRRVKFGDKPITLERCEQLLSFHLYKTEQEICRLVTVPINQQMFDALVSLVYNVGVGNFAKSTLLQKLNQKCYTCAAQQFPEWVRSGGKTLPGLIDRRFKEKVLFMSGPPPTERPMTDAPKPA